MKREAKLEEIIWKYLCAVIDLEDGKQLAQAIAQDEREMLREIISNAQQSTDLGNNEVDKAIAKQVYALANFGGD